jgi:hypothetical protein
VEIRCGPLCSGSGRSLSVGVTTLGECASSRLHRQFRLLEWAGGWAATLGNDTDRGPKVSALCAVSFVLEIDFQVEQLLGFRDFCNGIQKLG